MFFFKSHDHHTKSQNTCAASEWGYTFAQEAVANVHEQAETAMAKEGFTVSSEIMTGTPYYAIATYAEERNMDLIIIRTHGRQGVQRLLMGSTIERVLRTAKYPVLSVQPPLEYLKEDQSK
jgi:nucleotide-binding universal stress UspA family protein